MISKYVDDYVRRRKDEEFSNRPALIEQLVQAASESHSNVLRIREQHFTMLLKYGQENPGEVRLAYINIQRNGHYEHSASLDDFRFRTVGRAIGKKKKVVRK